MSDAGKMTFKINRRVITKFHILFDIRQPVNCDLNSVFGSRLTHCSPYTQKEHLFENLYFTSPHHVVSLLFRPVRVI